MQQFPIGDSSQVAPARRRVGTLAAELGFNEQDAGRAALVATEIGTNLIKHAAGGELLVRKITNGAVRGLEVLGLDKGPGMVDVAKCLRDGYSTGGSPGTGLGAMERLSQHFEIYSRPGLGTAVLSQLWPDSKRPPPESLEFGALLVPAPGETECGDNWCYVERAEGLLVMGVDGLGHGFGAAQAAAEACRVFNTENHRSPGRLMQVLHEVLRPTRGAAITLLQVDWDAGRATSIAVGNVAAGLITGNQMKRLAADNGIVGHVISRPRELQYPCEAGTVVLLHSDGLNSSWQPERYPGLMQHHAALIAGVIYRDCKRGRDDCLVVVIRRTSS